MSEVKIGEKIQLIEKALAEANNDRNMALAQEGVLKTELDNQYAKCRELGVEPENLGTEIKKILADINGLFENISELLPNEYLQKAGL